jgi:hypothetical protein
VGVDPNYFSVRIHPLHSWNWADGLRMIATQDNYVVALRNSFVGLVFELFWWGHHVMYIFCSGVVLKEWVCELTWDFDLLVLYLFGTKEIFEPRLVFQPSRSEFNHAFGLASCERIAKDFDFPNRLEHLDQNKFKLKLINRFCAKSHKLQ